MAAHARASLGSLSIGVRWASGAAINMVQVLVTSLAIDGV